MNDVDMTIGDGEFMVLVGPSGCGKTTLLRSIGGLEKVTGGRILLGERDVTRLPPAERDLAMVFQNYALYPHMTVRQNLGYALRVRKTKKKEIARRVKEAAMLGLDDLLDRRPGALSGGQQQRVAMGRAIIREPAAFLMDEPLSNLDAKLRVGDAHLAAAAARPARHDDGLRHARPGRGDDARAARGGDARRLAPAGRRPAAALRRAGEHLRRSLHRLAVDEPPAGAVTGDTVSIGGLRIPLAGDRRPARTGA